MLIYSSGTEIAKWEERLYDCERVYFKAIPASLRALFKKPGKYRTTKNAEAPGATFKIKGVSDPYSQYPAYYVLPNGKWGAFVCESFLRVLTGRKKLKPGEVVTVVVRAEKVRDLTADETDF